MYNDGARVFVEFGPRRTLTKLVGQILEGKPDVVTIAVNPGKPDDDSDLQMREAAAQLAVAGVSLNNFDPWGLVNPFRKKKQVNKKRKTSLRLTAATYVSKRTKKMQQKIIDEQRRNELERFGWTNLVFHHNQGVEGWNEAIRTNGWLFGGGQR